MIKTVDTIEEFNKICSEYFKYHHSRFSCSSIDSKNYITGISFKITSSEQYKDPEVRKLFGSNVCILDDTLEMLGKNCKCSGKSGLLKGIEATEEDFYYIFQDDLSGKVWYESCLSKIELV